jgi:hypothetical protein
MSKEAESWLIDVAQDSDNKAADAAMTLLRMKFDKNYVWCEDLDYTVVKCKECQCNKA